jgi:hypothetical protein
MFKKSTTEVRARLNKIQRRPVMRVEHELQRRFKLVKYNGGL